jgi:hypothetical protein
VKCKTLQLHALFALAAVITALLSGCGGGSSRTSTTVRSTGRAAFTIKWPERPSRLIPAASNSIRITIMNGATQVATQLVTRPATFANFDTLPTGSLTAVADAFPIGDGTGTAQAHGTVPLAITANNLTVASLTLGTTITHIDLTNGSSTISRGAAFTLTATPRDAANNVVLVAPGGISWISDNLPIATVDVNGKVTGVTYGTAGITAKEPESGVSVTQNITVDVQITLALRGVGAGSHDEIIQMDGMSGANKVTSPFSLRLPESLGTDSQGRIYVGSVYYGILRLDDITGANPLYYAETGTVPTQIAFDALGRIYMSDPGNAAIVRIDNIQGDGQRYVGAINALGIGNLISPQGVAVDAVGRIYITDTAPSRLIRINSMENPSQGADWTDGGIGNQSMYNPTMVAVDKLNRIYLLEPGQNRIVRVDDMRYNGFISYSAPGIESMALDDQGRIYLGIRQADSSPNVIRIDDMNGSGRVTYNAQVAGNQFTHVVGISVR